jgi:hypothetical protein
MKRVINFSGGKTSALMTILLKPTEDDLVLFGRIEQHAKRLLEGEEEEAVCEAAEAVMAAVAAAKKK